MTKEEYASKLHLLQQECDRLRDDINNLESNEIIQQDRFEVLQQEYDKLNEKASILEEKRRRGADAFHRLYLEHAALKEKAEKMAASIDSALADRNRSIPGGHISEESIHWLRLALSSYNSNTNQNENT